jgi:hypothetical protein
MKAKLKIILAVLLAIFLIGAIYVAITFGNYAAVDNSNVVVQQLK